jgi:GTP cyclohydrolase I
MDVDILATRLLKQVADAISEKLAPRGCWVELHADHTIEVMTAAGRGMILSSRHFAPACEAEAAA